VYLNITYISDIFVAPVDKTENRKNGDLKKINDEAQDQPRKRKLNKNVS